MLQDFRRFSWASTHFLFSRFYNKNRLLVLYTNNTVLFNDEDLNLEVTVSYGLINMGYYFENEIHRLVFFCYLKTTLPLIDAPFGSNCDFFVKIFFWGMVNSYLLRLHCFKAYGFILLSQLHITSLTRNYSQYFWAFFTKKCMLIIDLWFVNI